jgi:hypothetical protein
VGIGTTNTDEKLAVYGTSYISGNTGIGTKPTTNEKLTVQGTSYLNGNVGIGIEPTANKKLKVDGDAVITGNLNTSTFVNTENLYLGYSDPIPTKPYNDSRIILNGKYTVSDFSDWDDWNDKQLDYDYKKHGLIFLTNLKTRTDTTGGIEVNEVIDEENIAGGISFIPQNYSNVASNWAGHHGKMIFYMNYTDFGTDWPTGYTINNEPNDRAIFNAITITSGGGKAKYEIGQGNDKKTYYLQDTGGSVGIGTSEPRARFNCVKLNPSYTPHADNGGNPSFIFFTGNKASADNPDQHKFTNTNMCIIERASENYNASNTHQNGIYINNYNLVLGIGAHPTMGFKTHDGNTPIGEIVLFQGYSSQTNIDKEKKPKNDGSGEHDIVDRYPKIRITTNDHSYFASDNSVAIGINPNDGHTIQGGNLIVDGGIDNTFVVQAKREDHKSKPKQLLLSINDISPNNDEKFNARLQTITQNEGINGNLLLEPSGGLVGIGTNNPSHLLHLNSSGGGYSTSSVIKFENTYNSNTHQFVIGNAKEEIQCFFIRPIIDLMENDKGFLMNNIGYVGIGTNNPGALLHVNGQIYANEIQHNDGELVVGNTSQETEIKGNKIILHSTLGVYNSNNTNTPLAIDKWSYESNYIKADTNSTGVQIGNIQISNNNITSTNSLDFNVNGSGTETKALELTSTGDTHISGKLNLFGDNEINSSGTLHDLYLNYSSDGDIFIGTNSTKNNNIFLGGAGENNNGTVVIKKGASSHDVPLEVHNKKSVNVGDYYFMWTGNLIGVGPDGYNWDYYNSSDLPGKTIKILNSGYTAGRDIFYRSATQKLEHPLSIWAEGMIACEGFSQSSDERIKINIRDISDNISLQLLRDISCCYYEYKDPVSRNFNTQLGFIAQQVNEHFPQAISLEVDIIPNEMRFIDNPQWTQNTDESNNTFKLTIHDLEDVSGNTKYKFYMSNDISGNDQCEKYSSTLENEPKSFIFDQSWNYVFLYGKEVDDFHKIEKNKLFQLNFSATQEIDRIQQQQLQDISGNKITIEKNETDIELLTIENNELKSKISNLENQLESVLKRLDALENN